MAYKKDGNQNAALSALALDQLSYKEGDKGSMAIDAPNANEIQVNDDGDEDDLQTTSRGLYSKFEDLWNKQQINLSASANISVSKNHHSMARQKNNEE